MDPYIHELYVDSLLEETMIEDELKSMCKSLFAFPVDPIVRKNVSFKALARKETPYDFIECSNFRVELEMLEEVEGNLTKFDDGVFNLINMLREEGNFVVIASFDNDDIVIEKTGWNWTEDDPEPPGRNT